MCAGCWLAVCEQHQSFITTRSCIHRGFLPTETITQRNLSPWSGLPLPFASLGCLSSRSPRRTQSQKPANPSLLANAINSILRSFSPDLDSRLRNVLIPQKYIYLYPGATPHLHVLLLHPLSSSSSKPPSRSSQLHPTALGLGDACGEAECTLASSNYVAVTLVDLPFPVFLVATGLESFCLASGGIARGLQCNA